ncbi:MAG: ElyC/SanA/YdcF family protein [Terriglobales bacterium]|jgi:uncharacterized SAM-binding protein YcdF (DUF218 family)
MKRKNLWWGGGVVLAGVGGFLFLLAHSGHFLVINEPRKSDVIVVLAGETKYRPACGLKLLDEGYAPAMLLDVPAEEKVYQWNSTELAENYVRGLSQAKAIRICPIVGFSTRAETADVQRCLAPLNARTVLLETSDYHTRRALSIFRAMDKTREYSVAACAEPRTFGTAWWREREWAKTNFYEWIRVLWWEAVDRWR